jgi:hypothetical protein
MSNNSNPDRETKGPAGGSFTLWGIFFILSALLYGYSSVPRLINDLKVQAFLKTMFLEYAHVFQLNEAFVSNFTDSWPYYTIQLYQLSKLMLVAVMAFIGILLMYRKKLGLAAAKTFSLAAIVANAFIMLMVLGGVAVTALLYPEQLKNNPTFFTIVAGVMVQQLLYILIYSSAFRTFSAPHSITAVSFYDPRGSSLYTWPTMILLPFLVSVFLIGYMLLLLPFNLSFYRYITHDFKTVLTTYWPEEFFAGLMLQLRFFLYGHLLLIALMLVALVFTARRSKTAFIALLVLNFLRFVLNLLLIRPFYAALLFITGSSAVVFEKSGYKHDFTAALKPFYGGYLLVLVLLAVTFFLYGYAAFNGSPLKRGRRRG